MVLLEKNQTWAVFEGDVIKNQKSLSKTKPPCFTNLFFSKTVGVTKQAAHLIHVQPQSHSAQVSTLKEKIIIFNRQVKSVKFFENLNLVKSIIA